MGVSLCYHLCKLGWTEVLLLEKSDLTHGSTWHAAGLCTHFAHNATIMEMRATSVRLYRDQLEAESGMSTGFHATGALRITRSNSRMDEFRHVQGLGRFMGYEFHIITPEELRDLHPLAEIGDGLIGGIYEPEDGHVDPSQATQAMAACARKMGAGIERNTRVTGIRRTNKGDWLLETTNGEIVAEQIVNASGTWCREVGAMMGVDIPVVPMLHQYLVTDRVDEVVQLQRELPIIRDPEESWYVRQERDGLICGPYEKEGCPWSIDQVPSDFAAELLPPDLDRIVHIVEQASRRVPSLENAGIKTIVNGPITFTPDANLLAGPAFGLDRAWLLTGSSMGVMEGGGAGKFLAEWIVAGEPPMDPIAVDPRRFGAYANRDYRVKKAVESFGLQFGIHFPREERPAARPVLTSPIYHSLRQQGAVFGAVYGWERPNWFQWDDSGSETLDSYHRTNWFGPVGRECELVQQGVGIADMTPLSKFELSGVNVEKFMNSFGANYPPSKVGRVSLMHVLNPSGGVQSEFTIVRLADDCYYLTSAAGAMRQDLELLRTRSANLEIDVKCVTSNIGVMAVMGPQSRKLLERATNDNLSNSSFPWLSAMQIEIAGVSAWALRVSYVGELGWELHLPIDGLLSVYQALIKCGEDLSVGHFGAFATDAMRLEKGFRAWGLDLTTERTPLEAGLDFFVKSENRCFIGRDAMLRRQESGNPWKMALLEIFSEGIDPFYTHPVFSEDKVVGMVTSGGYGHRTKKSLALAYFSVSEAIDDPELEVEIIGVRYKATVLAVPPYDPRRERMRGGK